jgi:hypothetical protein
MNLVGKVIGRLTVLEKAEKIKNRLAWKCRCSCGASVVVLQQALVKRGPTQSCGCLRAEALIKNLTEQQFGDWTVKSLSSRKKKPNGGRYWFCKCVCAAEKEVAADSLLGGKSTNCGCARTRPICPKGHVIEEWGRDKNGGCRACIKNRNFLRNYGITLEEYLSLWEYQNGKCALCGMPVSVQLGRPGFNSGCRAELDHEHNKALPQKMQVRGILCGGRWAGCNRKLGRLDKIEWLKGAIDYLTDPPARRLFRVTTVTKATLGPKRTANESSEIRRV